MRKFKRLSDDEASIIIKEATDKTLELGDVIYQFVAFNDESFEFEGDDYCDEQTFISDLLENVRWHAQRELLARMGKCDERDRAMLDKANAKAA